MMTRNRIAFSIALGFFVIWLGILVAGADRPPPPGFVWVVMLDLVVSWIVYLRVSVYMDWSKTRKEYGLLRAFFEGFFAGFVVALIVVVAPGGGEPSVQVTPMAHLIWFAVLGAVGAANAVLLYGLSAYLSRKIPPVVRA